MSDLQYPEGIDCVWLAMDREQRLGAFVTGGAGPIPLPVLESSVATIEEVEALLVELPEVTTARVVVELKRPDNFIEFARRGFFAYDWSDVHRTKSESICAYEQVAVPETPIGTSALPSVIAALAADVLFDLAFDRERWIKVNELIVPSRLSKPPTGQD